MAVRTTITNKGLQLLASSSQATGQYYWLGYYALAYVPDFWKTDTTINFPDPDCFQVNTGVPIEPTDIDPVSPSMQRLTTYGDMVWNVWQGDLTGTGFINESDGTPGGNLFGLTMYAQNIKKHYRYVLDENGNNLLVCWVNDPTSTTGEMKKQTVYFGTDGFVQSEMPIPAPLYYLGDVTGKFSTQDFFPDFTDSDENGSSIYPFITVETTAYGDITVPKVSADYRGYLDTLGNGTNAPYAPVSPGAFFDSTEIPPAVDPSFDVTGWYAANLTYTIPESTPDLNNNPAKFDTEFWKLHTSSNYNRWHAPVDNVGFILSSDLSNRNMAKTTKFFPISNYKTINSESGFTANGESVEVATAIQLTIDLDISPQDINDGSEPASLPSFDDYANADATPAQSPQDQYGNSVYLTTHSSFKFNRIGIYAVPLRKYPFVQDQGFTNCGGINGNAVDLQFQIDPDEEPVLFAVMDWDNTVTLDDTGNGISCFRAEVNVNLESPDGVEDTALIRDCTIFYNLYEDDALKWYQNQLIANAQTQNAITELGLEIGNLIQKDALSQCCPTPDLSELFNLNQANATGTGLRNLKDSGAKADNALRGIVTLAEGTDIGGTPYKLGLQSVALGFETAAAANNSTVAGGNGNQILFDGMNNFIGSGLTNIIDTFVNTSSIVSGETNSIKNASNSIIGAGIGNTHDGSSYSGILSGNGNEISGNPGGYVPVGAFIGAGTSNQILHSYNSGIVSGAGNRTFYAFYSAIGAGQGNRIDGTTSTTIDNSFIGAGFQNVIFARDSFIGAGRFNAVDDILSSISSGLSNRITDTYSSIGAGEENYIKAGSHSFIGAGFGNLIDDNGVSGSDYSGIIAGYDNTITGASSKSIIGAGEENLIDSNSERAGILAGSQNEINESINSIIGGGLNNVIINANNSFIGSGSTNRISQAFSSAILSGSSNEIDDSGTGTINFSTIAGGYNNYITYFNAGSGNNYVFIGGGNTNTIGNSDYSSILGGLSNSVTSADFATVIGGINATAKNYGEMTHSSGQFDANTKVRHSMLMARRRIPAATVSGELYLDGVSEKITIDAPNGGFISGSVTVTAYEDVVNANSTAYYRKLNFVAVWDPDRVYNSQTGYIALTYFNDTSNSSINAAVPVQAYGLTGNDYAPVVNPMQTDTPLVSSSIITIPNESLLSGVWFNTNINAIELNVSKGFDYTSAVVDVSAVWDITIYEK